MSESRALTHLVGQLRDRDFKTMRQLADLGLFPTSEAARKFVTRHKADLILGRKGARVLLVDKRSLDRLFETLAREETA
jgi:hypothetical protein